MRAGSFRTEALQDDAELARRLRMNMPATRMMAWNDQRMSCDLSIVFFPICVASIRP
jgi:hypothetical protein